ncbi:MAG: sulfotransferase [Steroidobacteraceae bacterium]|jgi:tetratricopeptide (TPR) repeat protein
MATGRNDRCPCGSGAKYKKCCGQVPLVAPRAEIAGLTLGTLAHHQGATQEELTPAQMARIRDLIAARQYAALESEARMLTERHRRSGLAWKALGQALMMQDKDAVAALRTTVTLRPNDPEAHANLGNALQNIERHEEAIASYQRAIAIAPEFSDLHSSLGAIYRQQRQPRAAETSCRRALELNSKSTAALVLQAALHADRGQFSEAEALCRQALALNPNAPQALADLAHLRRMTSEDGAWLTEATRLIEQGLPARQEAYLRYAIGKYCDDLRDFRGAFANFQKANELARRFWPRYDRDGLTRAVDLAITHYDSNWFERMRLREQHSAQPVFIIGMPRSGTSLAEQILASHPAVHGAGELQFWGAQPAVSRSLLEPAFANRNIVEHLAADFLQLLQQLSPDAARVVDKTPANFLYLGLIHAALPEARIICMRRNPIDTCLSIYFQNLSPLHAYAYDLQDLAHFYREYRRLMAHWRSVLPADRLLTVPYERLVSDPESWSRALVNFIGLPWDPCCLDFHLADRSVITASKWQVRQKISSASVERWRNYEPFIAPLLALATERDD